MRLEDRFNAHNGLNSAMPFRRTSASSRADLRAIVCRVSVDPNVDRADQLQECEYQGRLRRLLELLVSVPSLAIVGERSFATSAHPVAMLSETSCSTVALSNHSRILFGSRSRSSCRASSFRRWS